MTPILPTLYMQSTFVPGYFELRQCLPVFEKEEQFGPSREIYLAKSSKKDNITQLQCEKCVLEKQTDFPTFLYQTLSGIVEF